jgi:predicted MFS family arabinose efflux permease
MVDRHALGASILFCTPLAIGLCMLVPFMKWRAMLAFVLVVWGFCQAALITVSHTRVMKATTGMPALGASLNISSANLGIALGAFIGSCAIDVAGLQSVGLAAAVIIIAAIAAAAFFGGTRRRLSHEISTIQSYEHFTAAFTIGRASSPSLKSRFLSASHQLHKKIL